MLHATCAELGAHAAHRETCYQAVDPAGLARSLPGLAEVGGSALTACMGDPARSRRGKQFRSFTGLTPKASETGEPDRKGQPMSKAGSSLLRTTLVRAADHARKQDPQGEPILQGVSGQLCKWRGPTMSRPGGWLAEGRAMSDTAEMGRR